MKKRAAKKGAQAKSEPEAKVEFWCPRDNAIKMVPESEARWQQTCPNKRCGAVMVKRA